MNLSSILKDKLVHEAGFDVKVVEGLNIFSLVELAHIFELI